MATFSTQNVSLSAGVTPTYNTPTLTGDLVNVGGTERDFLYVKVGASGPTTLTIAPQVTSVYQDGVGNITPPTLSFTISASTDRIVGPIPAAYINSAGQAALGWTNITTVTFAAITLPAASRGYM